MVDTSLILRKISELETYREQIGQYASLTSEDYKKNWKAQRIIERTLQIMIETCSDIANHIISDGQMRVPTSYADGYKVLLENNVINAEIFDTMNKMAKFRNIVVHQYERVDADIVITILKRHLDDFDNFKNAILEYLGKQK